MKREDADYMHSIKTMLENKSCTCADRITEQIQWNLDDAQASKKRHKASTQCTKNAEGGCTACHFWSGTISALGALVGKHGIIS